MIKDVYKKAIDSIETNPELLKKIISSAPPRKRAVNIYPALLALCVIVFACIYFTDDFKNENATAKTATLTAGTAISEDCIEPAATEELNKKAASNFYNISYDYRFGGIHITKADYKDIIEKNSWQKNLLDSI